jgi:RNA polymerase subunit RPABC4/transcription elongation factor Spt4
MNTGQNLCPACGKNMKPNWKLCPWCKAELKGSRVCARCGKELKPAWKVCPYCGEGAQATDRNRQNAPAQPQEPLVQAAPAYKQKSSAAAPSTRILKEGDFKYIASIKDMTPFNNGRLVLYGDRLEYRGNPSATINISDIASVEIQYTTMYLIITTLDGGQYKFFIVRKLNATNILMRSFGSALEKDLGEHHELESWQSAIEMQRGRL